MEYCTTLSCFRDGGGYLLPTLLSKTDHSGLMIHESGDHDGQGRCWNSSSCSSNQDWTLLAMCIWASCHLEKLHHCYETSGLWDHLVHPVTYNVHPSTGSNSTIQCNYRTTRIPWYCCPNHHRSASMFHSWNQTFRIIGSLKHSPNINLGWCWNNMKDDWSDHTTYFQSSDVQVLWSSCHTFHILALLSVLRGSATAAILGM